MSLPKTVLHVLNSAGGGAVLSTIALMERFREQGILSCAVCDTTGTEEDRDKLREACDGRVLFTRLYWWNCKFRMPLWKRPLSELKQILQTGWSLGSANRVVQCAVRWKADLIHTNTILTPEGGMAARRIGLPHVWHLRELVGRDQFFRLPLEGERLGAYFARSCSKLVANSEASAQMVRDCLPSGLLEVVPNGIDVDRFTPCLAPRESKPIVVGMVANLTSQVKRHALFIDAAARVDRGLPIEWRIYGVDPTRGGTEQGDSYSRGLRQQVAAFGLSDRFRWPGHLSDPPLIMSQIDVLVHPCESEGFGRVVVEAMAAGLPVVGVRGGGVKEIVEHGVTGLLAEVNDAAGLALGIEQLARDPKRAYAMGLAGRSRAELKYSLSACARGVLAVYRQAMNCPLNASSAVARRTAAGSPLPTSAP